jgi:hypothetical protein
MMNSSMGKERGRGAVAGLAGGILGATLMITYAMVVSFAYKDVGLFTPLYHIGTTFAEPAAMMASMEAAMGGDGVLFDAGPAALGLLVHLFTGAAAGAVFGVLLSMTSLSRMLTVLAGIGFGIVVMLVNAYVGLPIVAEVFGGGDPIADMPSMAGWGTFFVEHLIFGAALGAVVAAWAHAPRNKHHDHVARKSATTSA